MLLHLSLLFAWASLAYSDTTTNNPDQQQDALYGGLIAPPIRAGSSFHHDPANSICGGTTRGNVHYITSQNLDSEFRWYIETPRPDSTCILRITGQLDQNNETGYVNLVPQGRSEVAADGSFPCGRTAGVDSALFDIPDQVDCDACVLEWIWKGSDFVVRQCADISVSGGDDSVCYGRCLNGGICSNGECLCPPGFSGTYCEIEGGTVGRAAKRILSTIFFIILILLLIVLLIILLYWCALRKIKRGEKDQIYNTNRKYYEFDNEQPKQPSGADQPAKPVNPEPRNDY